MRNSVAMVRDLGANHDRFRVEPKGGYFANTTADNHGFKTKLPIYQVPPNKEEIIPIGRPLWIRQTGQTDKDKQSKKISHETPAPCQYNLNREFDETKEIKVN